MRLYCALCGRSMAQAAVLIGIHPVGPVCAKRAGLLDLAKRKAGLVMPVVRHQTVKRDDPQTMDLFADEVAHA